jgi:uncharacterized repeat protein (TIGR03843 family)
VDKNTVLTILHEGSIVVGGQFTFGSNYTFLADVTHQGQTIKAVYKPRRGEAPLWDFPQHSLAGREVAAYLLSEALGWELVPLTVYRTQKAPLGAGSLQLFVGHDLDHHYFNFDNDERQKLKPVALFDLVANNADRKGGHVIFDQDGHLWAIDHGLCFHEQDKLRTVIWDFAGEKIPLTLLQNLQIVNASLEEGSPLQEVLKKHLNPAEIGAMRLRMGHLVEQGVFPQPPEDRRPYPWPPV